MGGHYCKRGFPWGETRKKNSLLLFGRMRCVEVQTRWPPQRETTEDVTSLNPHKRKKRFIHQYQSIPLELKIPKLQAIRIQCYQNHIVPTLYIYKYTRFVPTYVEKQVTHCFPMFCCRWYKCCPVYFCNTCQQDFHILSLVLFTMCYLSMLFKNLNVP